MAAPLRMNGEAAPALSKAAVDKPAALPPHKLQVLPRPLASDRVSFELSEEAMEALRLKLVSTPGLGAFGMRNSNGKPNSIHSPARPRPDAQDPDFVKWKVSAIRASPRLAPSRLLAALHLPGSRCFCARHCHACSDCWRVSGCDSMAAAGSPARRVI